MNAKFAVLALLCVGWSQNAPAQVVRQLTDLAASRTSLAAVDAAGATAFSISDADPFGTNPGHRLQVFRWNLATGAGTQITSFANGVELDYWEYGPSVSDDGQKVVFLMDGRLAMVNADGTGLVQLTTTPGTIYHFQIAGNGTRVVFDSPSNLTGNNPNGIVQVFVVESNGTGLRKLTSHTSHWIGVAWPSISDDGQRIAYLASQGSVDGQPQLAGILQDGTGFHWITNYAGLRPQWNQISGNGQSVAFQVESSSLPGPVGGCEGGSKVVLVDWDGTGLRPLDAPCDGNAAPGIAGSPDITDDAQTIFYAARNFGVYDVWRINRDRSGWMAVTNTYAEGGAVCYDFTRVAGGGARFAFACRDGEPWGGPNPDLSKELYAADGNGTNHRQLSDTLTGSSFDPDLTPDGNRVVFASSANPLHEPGQVRTQIYRMDRNGSGIVRLTAGFFAVGETSVSDDGRWIAFTGGQTVYAVRDDGAMLTDLLSGLELGTTNQPHIAADGSLVVFASQGDPLGEGLFGGRRIYRANRDGSGLARVSAAATDWSEHPRLDATKTWVVYTRAGKIRRTRLDGTVDQAITSLGQSDRPDTTAGTSLVVYQSNGNPVGTNADGNTEIFLWRSATGTTQQLTATTQGSNVSPRVSRDGAWVTFWSDAEFFGGTFAADDREPYRLEIATGRVERIGGLAGCASFYEYFGADEPAPVAVDGTGSRALFGWPGDCVGANRDRSDELFLFDRLAAPSISVGAGPAPTIVTWDVEPGPVAYDVIRGDVASLSKRGDGTVDLGAVVCVENDSVDASTADAPDLVAPAPGQTFFYLHRGSPGPAAGPGSYGRSSTGGERSPSTGGCPG